MVRKFQQEIAIENPADKSLSPLSLLEFKEFNNKLIDVLENLPEQQRIVFMMSRYDNLSHKDIAERLNISIRTVETHIGRALKSIEKSLKPLL